MHSVIRLVTFDDDTIQVAGMVPDKSGNIYFTMKNYKESSLWKLTKGSQNPTPQCLSFGNDTLGSLDWDGNDTLYICDDRHKIFKYSIDLGTLSRFTGTGDRKGYKDGPLDSAMIRRPTCIKCLKNGDLLVTDWHHVRRIHMKEGTVETFAGVQETFGYGHQDGPLHTARFDEPNGIGIFKNTLYISDRKNFVIRKITKDSVETLTKSPFPTHDQQPFIAGPIKESVIPYAGQMVVDANGSIFVIASSSLVHIDQQQNQVYKVSPYGWECYSVAQDNSTNTIYLAYNNCIVALTDSWKLERFLWIGHLKEQDCWLASIPKELIKEIAHYVRGECISLKRKI